MALSNRTLGRILIGLPLFALLLLAAFGALLVSSRTPVPPQYFGCWRSGPRLLAIEPPRNLTYYPDLRGSSNHVGGWIQHITAATITARILVFPLRFTIGKPPWQDSTGWHLTLDSFAYTRDSVSFRNGECQL